MRTMVAVEPLQCLVSNAQIAKKGPPPLLSWTGKERYGCLHSAQAQENSDRDFLPAVHLQFGHDEDRDDAECPIRNAGYNRETVKRTNDNIAINAVASFSEKHFPKIGYRGTLKDKKQQKEHTIHLKSDNTTPEDDPVYSLNSDS